VVGCLAPIDELEEAGMIRNAENSGEHYSVLVADLINDWYEIRLAAFAPARSPISAEQPARAASA
jgi:hypothetical protein